MATKLFLPITSTEVLLCYRSARNNHEHFTFFLSYEGHRFNLEHRKKKQCNIILKGKTDAFKGKYTVFKCKKCKKIGKVSNQIRFYTLSAEIPKRDCEESEAKAYVSKESQKKYYVHLQLTKEGHVHVQKKKRKREGAEKKPVPEPNVGYYIGPPIVPKGSNNQNNYNYRTRNDNDNDSFGFDDNNSNYVKMDYKVNDKGFVVDDDKSLIFGEDISDDTKSVRTNKLKETVSEVNNLYDNAFNDLEKIEKSSPVVDFDVGILSSGGEFSHLDNFNVDENDSSLLLNDLNTSKNSNNEIDLIPDDLNLYGDSDSDSNAIIQPKQRIKPIQKKNYDVYVSDIDSKSRLKKRRKYDNESSYISILDSLSKCEIKFAKKDINPNYGYSDNETVVRISCRIKDRKNGGIIASTMYAPTKNESFLPDVTFGTRHGEVNSVGGMNENVFIIKVLTPTLQTMIDDEVYVDVKLEWGEAKEKIVRNGFKYVKRKGSNDTYNRKKMSHRTFDEVPIVKKGSNPFGHGKKYHVKNGYSSFNGDNSSGNSGFRGGQNNYNSLYADFISKLLNLSSSSKNVIQKSKVNVENAFKKGIFDKNKLRSICKQFIDEVDCFRYDLCMHMIGKDHFFIIKFMIENNIFDFNHIDNFGNNVLHWAYFVGNVDVINIIKEKGLCDENKKNFAKLIPSEYTKKNISRLIGVKEDEIDDGNEQYQSSNHTSLETSKYCENCEELKKQLQKERNKAKKCERNEKEFVQKIKSQELEMKRLKNELKKEKLLRKGEQKSFNLMRKEINNRNKALNTEVNKCHERLTTNYLDREQLEKQIEALKMQNSKFEKEKKNLQLKNKKLESVIKEKTKVCRDSLKALDVERGKHKNSQNFNREMSERIETFQSKMKKMESDYEKKNQLLVGIEKERNLLRKENFKFSKKIKKLEQINFNLQKSSANSIATDDSLIAK